MLRNTFGTDVFILHALSESGTTASYLFACAVKASTMHFLNISDVTSSDLRIQHFFPVGQFVGNLYS